MREVRWPTGTALAEDVDGRPVGLFNAEWSVKYLSEEYTEVGFLEAPPA